MFKTVLIANRGEIAVRAIRTLRRLGITSVAVYSDADRNSAHVSDADVAVALGGDKASDSYLRVDKILQAARDSGAEAVFPGYGFLSENAEFAEACAEAGIAFIGPTPAQLRQFGLKHTAREIAHKSGVPLVPGSDLLASLDDALAEASRIGYPVMLKSTAGGGGIGLTRCNDAAALEQAFDAVQRQGQSFFNDSGVFIECFIDQARHIEVQIFGDGKGHVVGLGERDCSIQRRNQKVVEETPAPGLSDATRQALQEAAINLGKSVGYRSAGTVEFIYDAARDSFYFLEVNTRLQVEHPVTEAVFGVDLIEWMLLCAADAPVPFSELPATARGHAIEVRLYAEDPVRNFQPSPGTLTEVRFPADVRVDGWVSTGSEVSAFYDPLLAKLIVHAPTRDAAITRLAIALGATRLSGISTNLDYLRQIISDTRFGGARLSTRFLDDFAYQAPVIEVLEPGTYSSVQDFPGRTGYWDIGVPPSGPMDDYAFRLGNRIVGNDASAAGLECTLIGPTLRFHGDAIIALTGAPTRATLDDAEVDFWQPVPVRAGQTLKIGRAESGCRTYLAVRAGIDVPVYLGSRSTFVLGQFGGHAGRTLRGGDMLPIGQPQLPGSDITPPVSEPKAAPAALIPEYGNDWEIGVLYGPHGAPDFFTEEAIDMFFETPWEVHYNSNRLGVRLIGPKPTWTRSDGGEAGLHPSNIHDCEYAIGSINFTGDMPVILTRDGPSLGGFVCAATIASAELWKVGQVKPGDRIHFRRISVAEAAAIEQRIDQSIATLAPIVVTPPAEPAGPEPILAELPATDTQPRAVYRQAGDKYILLEYGPNVLDLKLRFRVHALMEALRADPIDGILELSPGVRSLQIRYESRILPQARLLRTLLALEQRLPAIDTLRVPTRVIYLPLAFEDSATLQAVQRYRETVREDAPWLPNNVDFIQRINGLESREQVQEIVYQASYLVMGLGDVYLGAPCAVPIDPRHRLLTSKYNPARTYTAEGTVGIGGVYMCIYGMDSPGGYQLVGRTLPIWNKFLHNPVFVDGRPWLLRFFDQVRFYPVTEAELERLRDDFRAGREKIRIEEEIFDLAEYDRFLEENADSITQFKARQQASFEREVALWNNTQDAGGLSDFDEPAPDLATLDGHVVTAEICGSVWKLLVDTGHSVEAGEPLIIVEAMKMEFAIHAPVSGVVSALHCKQGRQVAAGDALLAIEPS